MNPWSFQCARRRRTVVTLLLVLAANAVLADPPDPPTGASVAGGGVSTNAAKAEPRKRRDDLLKNGPQNDVMKSWNSSRDFPQGEMIPPPAQRPSLTPAQAFKLKEMLDERKNWLFASQADANQSATLGDVYGTTASGEGGSADGTPQVLKRFLSRAGGNRFGATNAAGRAGRDDLGFGNEEAVREKPTRDNLVADGTRSVFDRAESAANKAISRLFEPGSARELPVEEAHGGFSDVFAPPAAIPMERSQADLQRMSSFQDILNSSAATPPSPASSLPDITPARSGSAGGFGGLDNAAFAHPASGFGGLSDGSSSSGVSSPAIVSQPDHTIVTQFEPVTPPRRRF